jgi:hypothetical protein
VLGTPHGSEPFKFLLLSHLILPVGSGHTPVRCVSGYANKHSICGEMPAKMSEKAVFPLACPPGIQEYGAVLGKNAIGEDDKTYCQKEKKNKLAKQVRENPSMVKGSGRDDQGRDEDDTKYCTRTLLCVCLLPISDRAYIYLPFQGTPCVLLALEDS